MSLKAPAPDAVPVDFPSEILRMERLVTCMPAKTYPFTLFMYEGIYRIIGAFYFNLRLIIFHVNLAHCFFRIIKGVLLTYNEQDCNYLWITHSSFFFSSTQNCSSNLPITKFTGFFCIHSNKKVPFQNQSEKGRIKSALPP